jgi:hypothetical protein
MATDASSSTGMDSLPRPSADEIPQEGSTVYTDIDRFKGDLGIERELELAALEQELLAKKADLVREIPNLEDGGGDTLLGQYALNGQELKRKESFLKEIAEIPGEHPYLTTIAIAALLYFSGLGAWLISKLGQAAYAAMPSGKMKTAIDLYNKIPDVGGAGGGVAKGFAKGFMKGLKFVF